MPFCLDTLEALGPSPLGQDSTCATAGDGAMITGAVHHVPGIVQDPLPTYDR